MLEKTNQKLGIVLTGASLSLSALTFNYSAKDEPQKAAKTSDSEKIQDEAILKLQENIRNIINQDKAEQLDFRRNMDFLVNESSALKDELIVVVDNLQDQQKVAKDLGEKNKEIEQKLEDLNTQLEQISDTLNKLNGKTPFSKEDKKTLGPRSIPETENAIQKAKQKGINNQEAIKSLESDLGEANRRANKYKDYINKLNEEIASLDEQKAQRDEAQAQERAEERRRRERAEKRDPDHGSSKLR